MSRKEFTVKEGKGNEVKLAIRKPLYEDYEVAEKIYATKVAALIKESVGRRNLLLRSDLEKFLKEHEIWTPKEEEQLRKLNQEVDKLLNKMRQGGLKLSEGRELAISVMDKRKEVVRLMSKRQIFDDTTIEAMAESERNDYLVYASTVYADSGRNYWDSFEDMKNDKLSDAYRQAAVVSSQVIYNIDPEFEKNLPENKWLKKYNFIDGELNYVDRKTGEKVDRDGKPVKSLEQEAMRQLQNLQGEIVEETPFIDDETGEAVPVQAKEEPKEEDKEDTEDTKEESAVQT